MKGTWDICLQRRAGAALKTCPSYRRSNGDKTLSEKQMYEDENRCFHPDGEDGFAFSEKCGRPVRLIRNVSLTHFRTNDLKSHC